MQALVDARGIIETHGHRNPAKSQFANVSTDLEYTRNAYNARTIILHFSEVPRENVAARVNFEFSGHNRKEKKKVR